MHIELECIYRLLRYDICRVHVWDVEVARMVPISPYIYIQLLILFLPTTAPLGAIRWYPLLNRNHHHPGIANQLRSADIFGVARDARHSISFAGEAKAKWCSNSKPPAERVRTYVCRISFLYSSELFNYITTAIYRNRHWIWGIGLIHANMLDVREGALKRNRIIAIQLWVWQL